MFKKGQSGNPAGTKKGTVRKNTLMENALKRYSEKNGIDAKQEIINKIIAQSLDGDIQSQKIILDRLSPSLKAIMPTVELPRMPKDLFQKGLKILQLVSTGDISSDIARDLLSGISSLMTIKEKTELEERLSALESVVA